MMQDFVIEKNSGVWLGYFPRLKELGIKHAFTTKLHGHSTIMPDALNMSLHVGDRADMIIKNRKDVCTVMDIDFNRLTTAQQVHGTNCVYIGEGLEGRGRERYEAALPETDAIYTDREGVPLMLLFADCTPVIFADVKTGVVGAIHAGWRGTVDNIVKKTLLSVSESTGCLTEDIVAAVGPAIGPCCYRVDHVVYDEAAAKLDGYEELFTPAGKGEWFFDLWAANKKQLLQSGLKEENVLLADVCTMCEKELFFSHRADNGKTGRLAAIICR